MAGNQRPGRGALSRLLWLFGALAVIAAALLTAPRLHQDAFARANIWRPDDSTADRYFRALGAPPGAGPLTGFRHNDQDGMVAEYASGSYRVRLSRDQALDYYRAACRRVGLTSPASAETLTYYPEALCSGSVIVSITSRCSGATCNVFVEVTG
jgi:hypothetical protein